MSGVSPEGVAIIGMAGRFPGAADIETFWRNLTGGVESVTLFTEEELAESGLDPAALRQNPNYVRARGVVEGADLFDARFFGMTAKEAEVTDPQQRLFLETCWHALENAGYDSTRFQGLVGVYAGVGINTYKYRHIMSRPDVVDMVGEGLINLGNEKDYLATRVAYQLDLHGPALNVNTACSTSLVAVGQACQALNQFQCDMALAGAVSLTFPQKRALLYQEGGISSADGHTRTFDAGAQGTSFSDGLGVVVLKRLAEAIEDGDQIFAVVKGVGINNDGGTKISFTAPSADGQTEAIVHAQADAGVDPDTISYIECHGTATPLGDTIELSALTKAFRTRTARKQFCAVGSVKSNIGHIGTAAGAASLIKTALALKNKVLPPSLHYTAPNPQIDFANSPFYVNTKLSEWPTGLTPRRAGVSSFGFGGTNGHLVLEEAPVVEASGPPRDWQLLVLSAKSAAALDAATTNLGRHFRENPELNFADAAYTLQVGRRTFDQRRVLVARDGADAAATLAAGDPQRVLTYARNPNSDTPAVVFMFPGQGSQYVGMAEELYQTEPTFRDEIDRCEEILKPHLGIDLREILYPATEKARAVAEESLRQTRIAQPALFAVEYALAKLWMSWGIKPAALTGHGVGEYVAACLAGVFTLEDALALVTQRAKLFQSMPRGSMLAVPMSETDLIKILPPALSIANVNGPAECVVAGPVTNIEAFTAMLAASGKTGRPLSTSHALYSAMMEPAVHPFAECVKRLTRGEPKMPFISNVTGKWITADEARDPQYWARHLRQPVRFGDGARELLKNKAAVFLEVGPGTTLCSHIQYQALKEENRGIFSSLRQAREVQPDLVSTLTALGQLWLRGVPVDWAAFYAEEKRLRVSLPGYAFQRQRYWIERHEPEAANKTADTATTAPTQSIAFGIPRASDLERALLRIWENVLGQDNIGLDQSFADLGGHSLLAVPLISRINSRLGCHLSIATFTLNPTVRKLAQAILPQVSKLPAAEPARTATAAAAAPMASVTAKETDSAIITFRGEGSHPPLFFMHGDWAGGGYFCGQLAAQMGEQQPFYSVPPFHLGERRELTLSEMVEKHLADLRRERPHGPYLLGGYCIGAILAVEMARQLVAQGEEVPHLLLLDLPQWNIARMRLMWDTTNKFGDLLGWDLIRKIRFLERYPAAVLRWLQISSSKKLLAIGRRLGLTKAGAAGPTDGSFEGGVNLDAIGGPDYALYFFSACQHEIAPLSIPATLYYSDEGLPRAERVAHAAKLFSNGTVVMIPGNHTTCITRHVSVLAGKMAATLDQIFSQGLNR